MSPAAEIFSPGQIVWAKLPDMMVFEGTDEPHLFLDYIAEGRDPIEGIDYINQPNELGNLMSAMIYDCRMARIEPRSGKAVISYLFDSRMFTATRPEKADEPVVDPANEREEPAPAPEDDPTAA